jgi:hypothetical protein|tara:strand:- start:236 stop:694 length:459 start_codon:yes stop_codon:yes gene_type:complete
MFKVGDVLEAIDCELPFLRNGDIVEVSYVNPSDDDSDYDMLQFEDVEGLHWASRFKLYEGYTNQELIDRVEMAKSINGFEEEKVSASETQIAGNHYSKLKIQPMEYCLQNDLNYGQSNAIKYITRYKDKNGIEDLKKAIHCIELLIEFEEKL